MTFIRLGDAMAVPVAWLAAIFLVIFCAALLLVLVKAVLPALHGLWRDRHASVPCEELLFALKVAAGFGVVVLLLVYANYRVGTDIHGITIAANGDWNLSNPFGAMVGIIPAGLPRTVGVGSHTVTFYRANQSNSTTAFTDFYVAAADDVWYLSTNDGERVRTALGYGNLAQLPLEIGSDGGYRIMTHTYGPAGPVFTAELLAQAAFPASSR